MTSSRFQKIIIILFHLLFLTVPFFFTWVNEELFEFPKMLLVYGLTILIAALWAGRMILEKKVLVRATLFDWPILAFLISQILSTIFSIHPATSIMGYYTRSNGGLLSTLSYITLFYALVSNFNAAALKKLWLTIFIAAFGVTLYAIPEHYGHSLSCQLISGKYNVSCWVQDVKSRVFATFGQPNWLAAYAITLIPWGLIFFTTTREKLIKTIFGVTTFTLLITLLFTQSRSGFLGFAISLVGLSAWIGWQQLHHSRQKQISFKETWAVIAGLIAIVLILGSSFTPSIKNILHASLANKTQSSSTVQTPVAETSTSAPTSTSTPAPVNRLENGGTDSGEIRKIVWQGAINVWKRYPLLGSGVETFAYSYYQDRPMEHNNVSEWDFLYNKAHNEFLNFLATTGLVGLLSYLSLFAGLAIATLKTIFQPLSKKKTQVLTPLFATAAITSTLALSISNFFGFSTVMVSVLLFTDFASAVILLAKKDSLPHPTQTEPSSIWQIFALLLISFLSLFLLHKTFNVWRADTAYASAKTYLKAGYANESLKQLQTALKIRPKEALFHNQLANTYAQIAISLARQDIKNPQVNDFKQAALHEAATTLQLNPRHLNFYKSETRILITLAEIDPTLLTQAKTILTQAIDLAPTDPKLMYNLALIELSGGQKEQKGQEGQSKVDAAQTGIKLLEKTIEMKPNYEAARVALGKQYETHGKTQQALQQYQYIQENITASNQEVNQKIKKLSSGQL